jgi:membrane-bound lytic murein transglycosylase F
LSSYGYTKRIVSVFALGLILVMIIILISRSFMDFSRPGFTQLQRIRERGYLLAGTDKNSLSYFIYRGEGMGYQLELLESFAGHLGVPLKILACDDVQQLARYLDNHAIDLIALNLPVTLQGKRLALFSRPFGDSRLVLVQPSARAVTRIMDVKGDTIYVQRNPFMMPYYSRFMEEAGDSLFLKIVPDRNQEELVRMVAEGKIRYTLCEENLADMLGRVWENIDAGLTASSLFPYSWALHTRSDSLSMMLNSWIDSARQDHRLRKIYLNYYENERTKNYITSNYSSIQAGRLSPYDKELRKLSRIIWWDWRLIASLMYEESNFSTGQVSTHLATGLMQLIPETAEKMGLDSAAGPYGQIAAGIRYLKWIDKQLPDSISDPRERVCFILAAYNIGIGKVLSLREKARIYGKDPNRWNGNVEYYLLKRSRKDPYAKGDSLAEFPVDYNLNGYVGDILSRYFHYRNLIPR